MVVFVATEGAATTSGCDKRRSGRPSCAGTGCDCARRGLASATFGSATLISGACLTAFGSVGLGFGGSALSFWYLALSSSNSFAFVVSPRLAWSRSIVVLAGKRCTEEGTLPDSSLCLSSSCAAIMASNCLLLISSAACVRSSSL